jgi:endoglucanase
MIRRFVRRVTLVVLVILSCYVSSAYAAEGLSLIGVNLSGAELNPEKLPGTLNQDYIFPTCQEIGYYARQGFNVIRLPVQWERLQPLQDRPLSSYQILLIKGIVRCAAEHGMKLIIDIHNYGMGYGHLVGSPQTPDTAFADLWSRLAKAFADDRNVIFGLMNEPHVQTPTQWLPAANAAITAIRAVGAGQEILVPGIAWDGAWTWLSSGNAAVLGNGIKDPGNNFAFEVHQYLDADGSGTHWGVVSTQVGVQRLSAITDWARETHHRLFLGEFGVANNPPSLTALRNMLSYLAENASVWQGGTIWAGGAWWGSYPFSVAPVGGQTKPQLAILRAFAPKRG